MKTESPSIPETADKPSPQTHWILRRIRGCVVAGVVGLFAAYQGYNYYFGPQPQADQPDTGDKKREPESIDKLVTGTVIFDMQNANVESLPLRVTRNKESVTVQFLQAPRGKGLLLCLNEHGYTVCNADILGNRFSSHVSTVEIWDDELVLGSRTRWYTHMRAHLHVSDFLRLQRELHGKTGRVTVTIRCMVTGLGEKPQEVFAPLTFERE